MRVVCRESKIVVDSVEKLHLLPETAIELAESQEMITALRASFHAFANSSIQILRSDTCIPQISEGVEECVPKSRE
jgi:hypothetical protein